MLNLRFLFFVLVLGVFFTAGLGVGYVVHSVKTESRSDRRLGVQGLVNPLLDCSEEAGLSHSDSLNLNRVHEKLKAFRKKQSVHEPKGNISVYLRDLNNGPWLGLNEVNWPLKLLRLLFNLLKTLGYLKKHKVSA